jgi:hypothetical protein
MYSYRFSLLILLLLIPGSTSVAQQLNHNELIEILGIKSWRVPMPKDESLEWKIEIVDYVPRNYAKPNMEQFNRRKKALVVLRRTGEDTYEFMLKQRGTSQGDLKIDICSDKEKRENDCDSSYVIDWFDVPKPYNDGTKFVVADISQMIGETLKKQIILEPVHFRLDDIIKEKRPSQSASALCAAIST